MKSYDGKFLSKPEVVLFEVADRIARIMLNRPDKRNALTGQLLVAAEYRISI